MNYFLSQIGIGCKINLQFYSAPLSLSHALSKLNDETPPTFLENFRQMGQLFWLEMMSLVVHPRQISWSHSETTLYLDSSQHIKHVKTSLILNNT